MKKIKMIKTSVKLNIMIKVEILNANCETRDTSAIQHYIPTLKQSINKINRNFEK